MCAHSSCQRAAQSLDGTRLTGCLPQPLFAYSPGAQYPQSAYSPASVTDRRSGAGERFVEVTDQVVGAFEADRQAHDVGAGTGGEALLVGELAVRRRGRMQDQAAR